MPSAVQAEARPSGDDETSDNGGGNRQRPGVRQAAAAEADSTSPPPSPSPVDSDNDDDDNDIENNEEVRYPGTGRSRLVCVTERNFRRLTSSAIQFRLLNRVRVYSTQAALR